ncbi:hypothetical protein NKH77_45095 [Streptomyces sp. M19]
MEKAAGEPGRTLVADNGAPRMRAWMRMRVWALGVPTPGSARAPTGIGGRGAWCQ